LLPLFVLVGSLPRPAAFTACRSFSALGLGAVLLIAGTALVQSWQWIGSLGGLFGTQYGRIALLKLGLFIALLSLAAVNHFVLTDRLQPGANAIARRLLRRSIVAEVLLGALVILAAAFLASAAPATHEAPVWPFSWRPSLDVLSDANGRRQLWGSLLPVGIAGACVIIGLLWRPVFWVSLTVLGILLGLTSPRLASLLTTDAYPTTFARSPTEFADSSIVRGAALFAVHCSLCHGTDARGDGPIAQSLPVRPADLTAAHLWAHTEGDLFWYVSHGITAPSGASAMPAFADKLPSDDRWALIDFLKAHNAGQTVQGGGQWSRPVPLPQFDARCGDGSTIDLDDLRGRVVHIIAPGPENVPPPATATGDPKVATIVLSRQRPVKPIGAACATIERDAWTAFSIVLGVTPEALPETQALADQNGWLRARWRPGDPADWNDPTVLAAAIRDIVAHPLAVAASGGHIH
jgi:mono/diheme cytochrome c family protein